MIDQGAIGVRAEARRREGMVDVEIHLEIPPGSHIEPHLPADPFFIPTVVTFDDAAVECIEYPEPVEKDLGLSGARLTVYEGRVVITARVRAADRSGITSGTVYFQPCVGGACLPPRSQAWRTVIQDARRVA